MVAYDGHAAVAPKERLFLEERVQNSHSRCWAGHALPARTDLGDAAMTVAASDSDNPQRYLCISMYSGESIGGLYK